MTLRDRLNISVDVESLAARFLDLFDENERAALRFGMLPAEKMTVLETQLRNYFAGVAGVSPDHTGTLLCAPGDGHPFDFELTDLVHEVERAVTLEIYRIGDLVV